MLKFFSTGEHFKPPPTPNRFLPCFASPGESSSIDKRNYQDQFGYEFKQSARKLHSSSSYQKMFSSENKSFSGQNKYFQSQYDNIAQQKAQELNKPQEDNRNQNLERCSHYSNWKVVKERQFANQTLKPTESLHHSALIKKSDFDQEKEQGLNKSQSQRGPPSSSSSVNYLQRENMFVSKPLVRLDKDFKEQPLVKSAITVSDDTPMWCQSLNKFYTVESFASNKKARLKPFQNTDIFGNQLSKYDNKFQFSCLEPDINQRYEQTRMVVADKTEVVGIKTLTKEQLKRGKCRIDWAENSQKQKYDFPQTQPKIGATSQPFIKFLEKKRNPNKFEHTKIGESEVYTKIDKEKNILLKIGHGVAQTLNPLKY